LRRPARAELIWEGKYNANGRRVAPLRVALPFQTVETVNESAQERQRGFLFGPGFREEEWRNRLIWGDKKYVLPSLLAEFAGKVNLIYIDPPFDTGADFSYTATIPDDPDSEEVESVTFTKEPSIIEHKAYRDTWGRGLDSYLQWFYEAAISLHELLHETGSLYVHLDSNVVHHVKVILDEIFGTERHCNDIIWKRKAGRGETNRAAFRFGVSHEIILFYAKSDEVLFSRQFTDSNPEYIESKFTYVNEHGRRYRLDNITSPSYRRNLVYEYKGIKPPPKGWAVSLETMKKMDVEGRLYIPNDPDKRIQRKRFLDELEGETVDSLWTDISPVNSQAEERLGYPTQKPEALLERILKASSKEDDLVLEPDRKLI